MNSLDLAVPFDRRRGVEPVAGKLLVDRFYLQVCVTGIGRAVQRGRVQKLLGLFGI